MVIHETNAPLVLHPEQAAVLRAMSARDEVGNFRYSTWVYSAPKKSGKTTIGAAVALWQAWRIPNGSIYIIGNDLNQADSRMAEAIRYAVQHNPAMAGRYKVIRYSVELDNGTRIYSIPVDPHGEAGMNPTALFWTEAWGMTTKAHNLLWSEAALSPTRAGQSFKFVESYAGYVGESAILESLYDAAVTHGTPHGGVPELTTRGGMIAYWCTRRLHDWQTSAQGRSYYADEEARLTPSEYRRLHHNEWADSLSVFVPIEWWHACAADIPPMDTRAALVLAIDAGVTDDCFAVVGVTRDRDAVSVRYANVWKPDGDKLDWRLPEAEIRRLCKAYNVVGIAYDPYQMENTAQRLGNELGVWFKAFNQGADRLVADKQLYDLIRDRRIRHSGEAILTEHISNANAKPDGDKLRIVKRVEHMKIDAAVALSMACAFSLNLNLG